MGRNVTVPQRFVITQPAARSGGTTMGGPVMSRAVEKEEDLIPDELKTVFDWCKEGHVTNLAAMVTADNINKTCDNVRCNAIALFPGLFRLPFPGSS